MIYRQFSYNSFGVLSNTFVVLVYIISHLFSFFFFFVCSMQFAFNMDQGIPVWPEWLVFNRVNARARKGIVIGPTCLHFRYSCSLTSIS